MFNTHVKHVCKICKTCVLLNIRLTCVKHVFNTCGHFSCVNKYFKKSINSFKFNIKKE